jgi:hypothetical protein
MSPTRPDPRGGDGPGRPAPPADDPGYELP